MSNETTMAAQFGKYGSRYETTGKLGKVEIAKAIRADIKFAQTLPETNPMRLPKGIKVSVRCQFYANGSSIHVNITAFPGAVVNAARIVADRAFPSDRNEYSEHTKEVTRCVEVLERITNQYNFDKSDIQTDYFHVNFYAHVGVNWKVASAAREAVIASDLGDVKVTIGAGDLATARAQIHALNSGFASNYEQRETMRTTFAEVA